MADVMLLEELPVDAWLKYPGGDQDVAQVTSWGWFILSTSMVVRPIAVRPRLPAAISCYPAGGKADDSLAPARPQNPMLLDC